MFVSLSPQLQRAALIYSGGHVDDLICQSSVLRAAGVELEAVQGTDEEHAHRSGRPVNRRRKAVSVYERQIKETVLCVCVCVWSGYTDSLIKVRVSAKHGSTSGVLQKDNEVMTKEQMERQPHSVSYGQDV